MQSACAVLYCHLGCIIMYSVLCLCILCCVLCCFIFLCHGTFSVLLYSFSVLLYSSLLLCCSLLFILLCSSCYVCILVCIYCTLTLPPGVNPTVVNKYLCTSTLAATYFSTISHERHDFWKKVTEHKMCAFIFCTNLFETLLILRINQGDYVISVKMSSCKVLVILVTF